MTWLLADTLQEALMLKNELIELFSKGGFALSKWASTASELVPEAQETLLLHEEDSSHLKVLGLAWDPKRDSFLYSIHRPESNVITKRAILSCIARIFDPLGLLAPVILRAKLLLQDVWKSKLDWDQPVSHGISEAWTELVKDWDALAGISIPRYFGDRSHKSQVVGFCDASDKGYAAALYLRVECPIQGVKVHLVKAKTKVAPLKYFSVARLELCGALLLTRLISSIQTQLSDCEPICFTDSTVVLSWIRKPLHTLKVFEANRVSEILTVTSVNCWRSVRSHENAADIASRGCSPGTLRESSIWWNGPKFLEDSISLESREEIPNSIQLMNTSQRLEHTSSDEWMEVFSSFPKLIRTTARILRLFRRKGSDRRAGSSSISAAEFSEAELKCLIIVQAEHLPRRLVDGLETPKEFLSLSPFLDECDVVRVGGRLQHAPLEFSSRQSALLPRQSHFAKLLVDDVPRRHFHAGLNLTSALLRTKYWIPGSTKFIRGIIGKCTHCRIRNAAPNYPVMSALPKERYTQFRTFVNTGIDYAGPFSVKESQRRNAALGKSYLCIFICMASKAVHLEAVSSMTTASFLAAMDRFVARRGLPKTIFSDQGSNFIGASRFLKELYIFLAKNEDTFSEYLAPRNIEWKFIPPRTPHFGELWEAGVKSVKTLLTGTVGKQPLTFEELTTVFIKIEGLLNSRPLYPLTEDATDTDYLTPGHLMIGSSLSFIPELPCSDPSATTSSRWQSLQLQINHLWNKWRLQYLNTL